MGWHGTNWTRAVDQTERTHTHALELGASCTSSHLVVQCAPGNCSTPTCVCLDALCSPAGCECVDGCSACPGAWFRGKCCPSSELILAFLPPPPRFHMEGLAFHSVWKPREKPTCLTSVSIKSLTRPPPPTFWSVDHLHVDPDLLPHTGRPGCAISGIEQPLLDWVDCCPFVIGTD